MTEAEWLICTDQREMLSFLHGKASERKLRLFACACCRRAWHHLEDKRSRVGVMITEKMADGMGVGSVQLDTIKRAVFTAYRSHESEMAKVLAISCAAEAVAFLFISLPDSAQFAAESAAVRGNSIHYSALRDEWRCQAGILHDIFGNPFHPVAHDTAGQSSLIRGLAQAAYNKRSLPAGHLDPDRLAVLADALEDSGCTDAEILDHLRGPGPHVRGCFVVDLILGKE